MSNYRICMFSSTLAVTVSFGTDSELYIVFSPSFRTYHSSMSMPSTALDLAR